MSPHFWLFSWHGWYVSNIKLSAWANVFINCLNLIFESVNLNYSPTYHGFWRPVSVYLSVFISRQSGGHSMKHKRRKRAKSTCWVLINFYLERQTASWPCTPCTPQTGSDQLELRRILHHWCSEVKGQVHCNQSNTSVVITQEWIQNAGFAAREASQHLKTLQHLIQTTQPFTLHTKIKW